MQITINHVNKITVVSIEVSALDAGNAKDLKAKMSPLITEGAAIVLNMGKLKFVDSSGLGSVLYLLRQLESMNGKLKLCSMTKPVRSIFELVRMHKVFEIHLTEEEALHAFEMALAGTQQPV